MLRVDAARVILCAEEHTLGTTFSWPLFDNLNQNETDRPLFGDDLHASIYLNEKKLQSAILESI